MAKATAAVSPPLIDSIHSVTKLGTVFIKQSYLLQFASEHTTLC